MQNGDLGVQTPIKYKQFIHFKLYQNAFDWEARLIAFPGA